MGRLIDCNDVYNAIQITTDNFGVAKRVVEDNMLTMLSKIETVEAIPKDQYEARLKADLAAMLEELRLEFEEYEPEWAENEDQVIASNRTWDDFDDIIQQKINVLKAGQEADND